MQFGIILTGGSLDQIGQLAASAEAAGWGLASEEYLGILHVQRDAAGDNHRRAFF